MAEGGWSSEGSARRLPRLDELPTAPEGYDPQAVREAFDAFYRHAAELDSTLRTLEAVDAFQRQAAELRGDIRSLRAASWSPGGSAVRGEPWYIAQRRRTRTGPAGAVSDAFPRVVVETAFILVVAVGAALAGVSTPLVVALVAAAWAIVGAAEVVASVAGPRLRRRRGIAVPAAAEAAPTVVAAPLPAETGEHVLDEEPEPAPAAPEGEREEAAAEAVLEREERVVEAEPQPVAAAEPVAAVEPEPEPEAVVVEPEHVAADPEPGSTLDEVEPEPALDEPVAEPVAADVEPEPEAVFEPEPPQPEPALDEPAAEPVAADIEPEPEAVFEREPPQPEPEPPEPEPIGAEPEPADADMPVRAATSADPWEAGPELPGGEPVAEPSEAAGSRLRFWRRRRQTPEEEALLPEPTGHVNVISVRPAPPPEQVQVPWEAGSVEDALEGGEAAEGWRPPPGYDRGSAPLRRGRR